MLVSILLIVKYARGFIANISVLLGIVDRRAWWRHCDGLHDLREGRQRGLVRHRAAASTSACRSSTRSLILTMSLIMVVVMIESTGMFLALGEMTDRKISQQALARGLRTDGLGTLIGGIFNTFPYTSFSQNVGPGGRDRHQEPLRLRGRRRDPDGAGPAAEDGGAGRVAAARWCWAAPAW